MDISGDYTLYAPRQRVWDALLDPQTLQATVPGCESLERESEDTYHVRLNVGVAAVKGLYEGTLRIVEQQAPEHYRMVVSGKGARGMLHGDGTLHLEARDANTTVVTYAGQAQLGGAIAGVGMRVAGGAANMMIKGYFAKLADTLVENAGTPSASGVAASPAASTTADTAAATVLPTSAVATPATNEAYVPLTATSAVGVDDSPSTAATPDVNGAFAAPILAPAEQRSAATSSSSAATSSSSAAAYALSATVAAVSTSAPTGAPSSVPRAATPTLRPQRTPLMQMARRTGLTDGSVESEQLWARRLLGAAFVGAAAIIVAIGVVISQASHR